PAGRSGRLWRPPARGAPAPAARRSLGDMQVDTLEAARELAERGEAFAMATVVWRRSPSSGQVGSRALITTDGHIRGWLGGACAEPAVIAEARRAIAEGTARLM